MRWQGARSDRAAEHVRFVDARPRFPQDPAKVGEDYIWKIYPRRDGWEFMGEEMRTAISDTEDQCRFQWYEYIYGKYDKNPKLQASLHNTGTGAPRLPSPSSVHAE